MSLHMRDTTDTDLRPRQRFSGRLFSVPGTGAPLQLGSPCCTVLALAVSGGSVLRTL